MSDTIDDYRALKQFRQAEAATKRAEAPDWLRRLNVDFTEHNGTVQGLPTIDLICVDEQGNKHVMMITGRLLKAVVDVAFSVQQGSTK